MNSGSINFVDLIPCWLAATKGHSSAQMPVTDLESQLYELRAALRGDELQVIESDDRTLTLVSRLCFELCQRSEESCDERFREAANAYRLVASGHWRPHQLVERNEVMSYLALAAWRNARLSSPTCISEWEEVFRKAVLEYSRSSSSRQSGPRSLWRRLRSSFPFCDPLDVFMIYPVLTDCADAMPVEVAQIASDLYALSIGIDPSVFQGDEREYVLGCVALVAGAAYRLSGKGQVARIWLSKAEAAFSRSAAPAQWVRLSYQNIALLYGDRLYEETLAAAQTLVVRCKELGMPYDLIKCRLLEAVALKEAGRHARALSQLLSLRKALTSDGDSVLLGYTLLKIGELHSSRGRLGSAMRYYREALDCLRDAYRPLMVANLKGTVGETLRDMGQFGSAIEALRESISDYAAVGNDYYVAYTRIVLAETLLIVGRPREAECEILAALPTIENEHMVRDGLAALALLRESVSRSDTDRVALQQLAVYLRRGKDCGRGG